MDPEIQFDDQGNAIGTGNEARLKLLQSINDRNDAKQADQFRDVNDDETTSEFVVHPLTDEQQAAREAALQDDEDGTTRRELQRATDEANQQPEDDAEDDVEVAAAPAPVKHKVKVNGKDLELTTEELISRAQKVEAADQYLIEASRMRREAEDRARQLQNSQSPEPSQEDQAAMRLEERRALVRAIQMGTEDEAMAALEKLQMQGGQPQFDPSSIARTVDERLTFKEAAVKFQSDYKDLFADPVLRKMVLSRDQELLNTGDKRDYVTRYTEIGNEVRAWRDNLIKSAAPEKAKEDDSEAKPSLSLAEKQSRKAAAPQVPKAANTKAPAAQDDEDDKEESVQDVIAKIAKQRGGPQWLRA